tara:strand:+ start:226 stop:732 length:507 start_codon:yes stop_codon:yes gene_type:complete
MIAIFKTGGKQYCVEPGQILKVEKLEGEKGDSLTFSEILIISDKSQNDIGNPLVKGASINAKIIDQIKDDKIIVFKKRRRKNSKQTRGHRQKLTLLKIESINKDGNKSALKNKSIKSDATEKTIKQKDLIDKKTTKKTLEKKTLSEKLKKKKKTTKKTIVKKKKSSKK